MSACTIFRVDFSLHGIVYVSSRQNVFFPGLPALVSLNSVCVSAVFCVFCSELVDVGCFILNKCDTPILVHHIYS